MYEQRSRKQLYTEYFPNSAPGLARLVVLGVENEAASDGPVVSAPGLAGMFIPGIAPVDEAVNDGPLSAAPGLAGLFVSPDVNETATDTLDSGPGLAKLVLVMAVDRSVTDDSPVNSRPGLDQITVL